MRSRTVAAAALSVVGFAWSEAVVAETTHVYVVEKIRTPMLDCYDSAKGGSRQSISQEEATQQLVNKKDARVRHTEGRVRFEAELEIDGKRQKCWISPAQVKTNQSYRLPAGCDRALVQGQSASVRGLGEECEP